MPRKQEKNLLKVAIKTSSRRNTPLASRDNSDDDDTYSFTSDLSDETYMSLEYEEHNLDSEINNLPDEQMITAIENLTEKRTPTREEALSKIIKLFRHNYLQDEIESHQETLFKSLKRCLAKGQSTKEKVLASQAMGLLAITVDPEDEEMFESLEVGMFKVARDSDNTEIRVAYIYSLSMVCFVSELDKHDILSLSHDLLDLVEDDELPSKVIVAALSALGFLVTGLKLMGQIEEIRRLFHKGIDFHVDFLDHVDAIVRIASGENIAVFYEIFYSSQVDPEYRYKDDLIAKMNNLMHDHARYRNKKERRHQRLAFRDILPTIENGESPEIKLKFKTRSIFINSWVRVKQLQHFREALATGFHIHMEQNEILSAIFGDEMMLELGDGVNSPRVKVESKSALSKARAVDKAHSVHSRLAYLEENGGGEYVDDEV
ncbi:IFRD-domain-containing protein [Neoconidiobolus thromboides FSU 785]|nr:IFRD-domain-containing protein [Neoconidiobolus thromboides FSU 785]